MNHYAKIYSVWRIFDFVKNFAKKAREDWALRQTEPQNNLFLVKDLWLWLVSGGFSYYMGAFMLLSGGFSYFLVDFRSFQVVSTGLRSF